MFGIMQSLKVAIVQDGEEAIEKGFNYADGEYKAVEITQVVVVRNGTESGKSTVDFVMQDEDGNKFVVMLTGTLLKSIPA
jgi:hypothetical protein